MDHALRLCHFGYFYVKFLGQQNITVLTLKESWIRLLNTKVKVRDKIYKLTRNTYAMHHLEGNASPAGRFVHSTVGSNTVITYDRVVQPFGYGGSD